MVAALVAMEGSYFDADFFRRLGARELSNESNGIRDDDASEGRGESSHLLDADVAPQSTFDGADAHLRAVASSVHAYVDAVRARMAKAVPKAVVHCQVLLRASRFARGILRLARGYLRRGPSRVDAGGPGGDAAEGSVSRAIDAAQSRAVGDRGDRGMRTGRGRIGTDERRRRGGEDGWREGESSHGS